MPEFSSVLLTAVYHTNLGAETKFLGAWNQKIGELACKMGASSAEIFYNESSDEYLAQIYWSSVDAANIFLLSLEFEKASKEINIFCLIPSSRSHFEILVKRAA